MKDVKACYYDFYNKEDVDISDANFIRISFKNGGYLDVRVSENEMEILGEHGIKIMPKGGSNHICISLISDY